MNDSTASLVRRHAFARTRNYSNGNSQANMPKIGKLPRVPEFQDPVPWNSNGSRKKLQSVCKKDRIERDLARRRQHAFAKAPAVLFDERALHRGSWHDDCSPRDRLPCRGAWRLSRNSSSRRKFQLHGDRACQKSKGILHYAKTCGSGDLVYGCIDVV